MPPKTSDWEISADLPGKERQGEKGKWSRKEGKSKKGRWKIENGRKSYKMRRGPFFSFHFWKPLKFVLGLPKWEFSTGKKSGKMTFFAPSEKHSSYVPDSDSKPFSSESLFFFLICIFPFEIISTYDTSKQETIISDLPTLKNKNSYFDIRKFLFCTKNSYFSELILKLNFYQIYAKKVDNNCCFSLWRSCMSGANSSELSTHIALTLTHTESSKI